jgi:hypothetical protein
VYVTYTLLNVNVMYSVGFVSAGFALPFLSAPQTAPSCSSRSGIGAESLRVSRFRVAFVRVMPG